MTKVKLRMKPVAKGAQQSLYLDIYPPVPNPENGKMTRKHYLAIYLYTKPKTELERRHNKETQELALHIAATTQLDVQNKRYGFISERIRTGNFFDFYKELMQKRRGSTYDNWASALMYLKGFFGERLEFREINETICEEFADYLKSKPALGPRKKPISLNTASSYFIKFKYSLKQAYKKKLITENIGEIIEAIDPRETHREFLFQDELQTLADTACVSDTLKRASLVSALTGLRYSDIERLQWSEIRGGEGNHYFQFTQEKTRAAEVMPVSDIVVKLLGQRGIGENPVFPDLTYALVNTQLKRWIRQAGIEKPFTFHCFRHTFATLQLASGTDIFTVSKMLGHKRLETTMIYVKIVDRLKQDAAQRVRLDISRLAITANETTAA